MQVYYDMDGTLRSTPVDPAFVKRVDDWLEKRGWQRKISGEENHKKAAASIATAVTKKMGLFVTGGVGTGKTRLMHIIRDHLKVFDDRPWKYLDLKDPDSILWLTDYDHGEWRDISLGKNLIVDDFGCEKPAFVRGIKSEAALDYIMRYIMKGRGMLCITTNLAPDVLMDRYASRLDCLRDVLVPLSLKGESARQWTKPETATHRSEHEKETQKKEAFHE